MKINEFINEDEMPHSNLIGKYTATMRGGVRYPGTVDKIVRDPYGDGYKARAVYANEPGSFFYKANEIQKCIRKD